MYTGAKEVKPPPGFRLLLVFENGERRLFDVSPYLDHGVFQTLRDPVVFNSVHISFDTAAWSNGADLCPEVLYRDSTPVDDAQVRRSSNERQSPQAKTKRHS
jgi:hypothetical protein